MKGSCGKWHFLFKRRLSLGTEEGLVADSDVLPHFAGRGRSMSHTVTVHPYDVNYGWPGALNPPMSQ